MRWLLLVTAFACGGSDSKARPDPGPPSVAADELPHGARYIPADTQRPGDPDKGYRALVEESYIGCGIPRRLYDQTVARWFRGLPTLSRSGPSADLPYFLNQFTNADGVETVTANCLSCHAGFVNGELVIGLGDPFLDFSIDPRIAFRFANRLVDGEREKAELKKLEGRVDAIAPAVRLQTAGPNPADAIAAALFSHRDPETLAWSDRPLIETDSTNIAPVDTPPWWRMAKKNAMFYTAAGRGDHARIMMTASTLCTDSVAEAERIDAFFPDIRAYIVSLKPPKWPKSIENTLATTGKAVFEKTCSKCHGTYGAGGRYPNLLIALDVIKTDPVLADGAAQFAKPFVDWFNRSFYGRVARLEPQAGYVAPPLDGIWATAPYLHNGSVPTLAALLDSSTRLPVFRQRRAYDWVNVGWSHEPARLGGGSSVYDTGATGYGNSGHTFGDALSPRDRRAVIEYLKTL